jgi:hypothetical protein
MTLGDLALPLAYEEAKRFALVFSPAIAARLAELHLLHGRPDCVPSPRAMIDGRMMLCADLLTATEPGGWLYEMWQAADKELVIQAVEVLPWADAVALLPPDEPIE